MGNMKVKENLDGSLVLDGNSLEGAREAFRADRIVEAFSLLHAFIEWEMANLIEYSHLRSGGTLIDLREQMQNYRFNWLLDQLCIKILIKPHENELIIKWYDIRNKIIHRLVAYSYHNYQWNRVTRKEVNEGFLKGQAIAEMLRKRTLEI